MNININSNTKGMLFRIILVTFFLLSLGIWIEMRSFSAIIFTINMLSGFIFLIDLFSYAVACSDSFYYKTAMGTISWTLFNGTDKKTINLKK